MQPTDRWLLPEGIEEALPPEAGRLEAMRRQLVDLYASWGYRLVMPPFIEYLESLLTGTGNDLDLDTFKVTDQLSGRMMGVRADMTPQVARIDAHRLGRDVPERLCYLGTVLRTRPESFAGSRAPLQVGAELFGHAGAASDLEVIALMAETLRATGVADFHLDIGHVGIYRALVAEAGLGGTDERALFDALQRKALPELPELLDRAGVGGELRQMFLELPELHGGRGVLARARQVLARGGEGIAAALDHLEAVADGLERRLPGVTLHFDLGELRGYHYHTGVVFAAFLPEQGRSVAQGGRYDDIGRVFGRARPATGFSADLRELLTLQAPPTEGGGIFAPADEDGALAERIAALRGAGERVVVELPGQAGDARAMGCDRQLVRRGTDWDIEPVAAD
ncbi:MAG: ATP phosphoribosyltransferase regulatory subunit [Pseudomonadota bacterium]